MSCTLQRGERQSHGHRQALASHGPESGSQTIHPPADGTGHPDAPRVSWGLCLCIGHGDADDDFAKLLQR